ncbi:sporulation protein [Paenibacillus sp. Leaf72]|uniref:sporulation protein n=1 Tax=Paenibacillus sp. Leaf72 TaxID=1736234 RepID=UPI0006F250DE|nr:sporulation protein [Paenibacillus sp. Leaf72]KQO18492.1 sporulation protein SpoOM [Paenibacillus sp. Leaf72]
MFNRLLASIGIGSAKIDTLLEKSRYAPGEEVRGVVQIRGGSVEQRIEKIELSVMTEYIRESNDQKHRHNCVIGKYPVSQPFELKAGENREVPFSFQLPFQTPLTLGKTPIWVKTELDIRGAIDPGDNDRIEVVPNAAMGMVLGAVEQLGFRLREADCEYASRLGRSLPFVQELEFVPAGGPFRGKLDELEVIFYPDAHQVELLLQIDRKARGLGGFFAEAMNTDETFVRVAFTQEHLQAGTQAIASQLEKIIARHA